MVRCIKGTGSFIVLNWLSERKNVDFISWWTILFTNELSLFCYCCTTDLTFSGVLLLKIRKVQGIFPKF